MYYFVYARLDWLSDTIKEKSPDQFTPYSTGCIKQVQIITKKVRGNPSLILKEAYLQPVNFFKVYQSHSTNFMKAIDLEPNALFCAE